METKQYLVVQRSAKDGKLVLDVHLTIVHTLQFRPVAASGDAAKATCPQADLEWTVVQAVQRCRPRRFDPDSDMFTPPWQRHGKTAKATRPQAVPGSRFGHAVQRSRSRTPPALHRGNGASLNEIGIPHAKVLRASLAPVVQSAFDTTVVSIYSLQLRFCCCCY